MRRVKTPRNKKKRYKQDEVTQYTFKEEKRLNIPQTGLVSVETDPINGSQTYMFDPHLDPELQWAGKTEGTSFEVDTVSLHAHERIDPLTIIEAVRDRELDNQINLLSYFEEPENSLPIKKDIEFYKHSEGWSNRLIAGDSLIVMNSLLEKEGMASKVQMIYLDPPYGIKYGSNFQPFVNKRDVKDGKDEDLTHEPEVIKAFRDTWELGVHSYLTYLRDNLLLANSLLSEEGSIFIQISDENLHHIREILDEIFGAKNFVSIITYITRNPTPANTLVSNHNYIIWYCKNKEKIKYRNLLLPMEITSNTLYSYKYVELKNGSRRPLSTEEKNDYKSLPDGSKLFNISPNIIDRGYDEENSKVIKFGNKEFSPGNGNHWSPNRETVLNLIEKNRVFISGNTLMSIRYLDDFPAQNLSNVWEDTTGGFIGSPKSYAVQTNPKIIERCLLMTTDPGDLVLDPTCGSGTTAFVAERWGRRWITCDTSRVAITLAKERLMTSCFDYYKLAHPNEGISSGFTYEKVKHITVRSVINNEAPTEEILYDKPILDKTKKRVTGPFTVEAVPSQRVVNLEEVEENQSIKDPDNTIARSGETVRQSDWIDELSKTGIRAKGSQIIKFAHIDPLRGTKWLQAEGETIDGQKVAVSFGPAYAPLEQRQVELAIQEAQQLVPKPKLVIFVSFQFDPEAAKDIDELKWPGVTVIKCQMNTDLLTEDLKKKKANEESSFWLIGQPDIELKKQEGEYIVTVNGFDYYDTRTGEIKSGNASNIAMWELDTDYNGRSLYPRQVFFPLEDSNGGWNKLAKTLRTYIDEDLISKYAGNRSLPFKAGKNKQIAIKIIDDRGIESLRVIRVD